MADDLHRLEAELKTLRPAAPSREVVSRVARALHVAAGRGADMPARPLVRRWAWWLALPAAAALAFAAVRLSRPQAGRAGPEPAPLAQQPRGGEALFKPVAAENVLYSAVDEGVVYLHDGTPARRERLHYVDTITWRHPRTNASVRWTVPREEVRVVPVTLQ